MKVEVDVLGLPVPNEPCGFCGPKATLKGGGHRSVVSEDCGTACSRSGRLMLRLSVTVSRFGLAVRR